MPTSVLASSLRTRRPRRVRLVVSPTLGVALLAGTWGCANLGAIRDFAQISSETVRYKQLVHEYVTIGERDASATAERVLERLG